MSSKTAGRLVSGGEAGTDISAAVLGIRALLHLSPLTSTGIAKAPLAQPLISAYSITPDKLDSAPTRHTAKSRPGLCAERGGGSSPGAGPVPSRPIPPSCPQRDRSAPGSAPGPPLQTSAPPPSVPPGPPGAARGGTVPPGGVGVCRRGRAPRSGGSAPAARPRAAPRVPHPASSGAVGRDGPRLQPCARHPLALPSAASPSCPPT